MESTAKFNILIVGGGLGGLAVSIALAQTGHNVTLLESTSRLQTIGGGITVPPNSMRGWDHLGLMERLKEASNYRASENRVFKRYNGEFLCDGKARNSLYKYEAITIHRAPLQKLLIDAAAEVGVTIKVNTRIVSVDEGGISPAAIAADGRRFEADLIIGADGAKSTLRAQLHPNVELYSEYNIYRAVIDGASLLDEPEVAPLLNESTFWWGPERVIASIPIQRKQFLSLELCHPGNTGTAGDWSKKGDLEQMKKTYADFELQVVKLLEKVKPENLLVWKLCQVPPLVTWVFPSGKVVLIADAAPIISLAECLSRASSTSDIPRALHAFEAIRKPRTDYIASYSLFNCKVWQLPDGEAQRQRDANVRKSPMFGSLSWDGKHVDEAPGLPPDPLVFPYIMAHDVVDFTKRKLDGMLQS